MMGPTLVQLCQGGTDAQLPYFHVCPPCTPGVILGWEKGSGKTGSSGDNSRGRRVSPLPAPSWWHRGSRGTGLRRWSVRAQGDIDGDGMALGVLADACSCVFMHMFMCVPPPRFRCPRVWPPAPTCPGGYFCLQPGFNPAPPVASV